MLHLDEIQTGALLIVACSSFVLATWALFVVIPNRNQTIDFLRDRNQTLQYWVENMNTDAIRLQIQAGTQLEKKMVDLQRVHAALNDQLRKCLIDINLVQEAIDRSKNFSNEQK